jgi:glyoxylase-like metal-dependent hydrolase (beta-lactamase superfamily II)
MRLVESEAGRHLPEDVRAVPRKATDVRATEIAKGIVHLRLPLPYPAPASVNCYLLAGRDGYTIVDSGTSLAPGWEALELALGKAGVEAGAIHTLVLTHMHSDHAGGAAALVERSGCEVVRLPGPDTANDAFRDVRAPLEERHAVCLREGVPSGELPYWAEINLADDGHHPGVEPDRLLAEGDVLDLDSVAGSWQVVPTPGHSPTQIALFDERRRWLLSADLAYGRGTPFLEFGHSPDPLAEHLASLDRVERLRPELLLPGHGRPAQAPLPVLARARNATLAACARVRGELSAQPRSAYEIALTRLGGERNTNRRQEGLALTATVLGHFERHGDVVAETGDDGVRRVRLPTASQ